MLNIALFLGGGYLSAKTSIEVGSKEWTLTLSQGAFRFRAAAPRTTRFNGSIIELIPHWPRWAWPSITTRPEIVVPYWLTTLAAGAGWVALRRRARVYPASGCTSCGYPTPNNSPRCPECGEVSRTRMTHIRPVVHVPPERTPSTLRISIGVAVVITTLCAAVWICSREKPWSVTFISPSADPRPVPVYTQFGCDGGVAGMACGGEYWVSASEAIGFSRFTLIDMLWPPQLTWWAGEYFGAQTPVWYVALAAWLLPLWLFIRRPRPGRCVYCRFDLRPLPARAMVECPSCFRVNYRRARAEDHRSAS